MTRSASSSVPLAPADGEEGRAPGAAQVGKAHDDGHDGDGQPQTGEGQVAAPRQAAQIDAVHHAVQHVDELGHRHGQGQGQNIFGDAPLGKVVCCCPPGPPPLVYLDGILYTLFPPLGKMYSCGDISSSAALKRNLALINARPRKVLDSHSAQELWDFEFNSCCT